PPLGNNHRRAGDTPPPPGHAPPPLPSPPPGRVAKPSDVPPRAREPTGGMERARMSPWPPRARRRLPRAAGGRSPRASCAAPRAWQVRSLVVARGAPSFEQMADLPRPLRQELAAEFVPLATAVERHLVASDGTEKLLLRLADGQFLECVLMREADRRTVCVS